MPPDAHVFVTNVHQFVTRMVCILHKNNLKQKTMYNPSGLWRPCLSQLHLSLNEVVSWIKWSILFTKPTPRSLKRYGNKQETVQVWGWVPNEWIHEENRPLYSQTSMVLAKLFCEEILHHKHWWFASQKAFKKLPQHSPMLYWHRELAINCCSVRNPSIVQCFPINGTNNKNVFGCSKN